MSFKQFQILNSLSKFLPFIEIIGDICCFGDSFFKTKQGVSTNQINNNVASGSTYINWFLHYTSNLSKTEDELRNMNLLIDSIDGIKKSRR